MLKRIFILFAVCLLISCTPKFRVHEPDPEALTQAHPTPSVTPGDDRACVVSDLPPGFSFDPFYSKFCDANGIPIIASADVDDRAFQIAFEVITNMLEPVPEVRRELISNGAYFGILGKLGQLTDLPEYAHMESSYWNERARGLGGSRDSPITKTAEENLLCLSWDRWYGESIAVHEFAHTIALIGLGESFDDMQAEFTSLYEDALNKGLWADTYAGSNIEEYWAEGVQSYFNSNLEAIPTDGVHNFVNTRAELAEYDPRLYEFIFEFFHGYEWNPACPKVD